VELDPVLPQPGALVAEKFRITRVLGMGGMGVVYQAHHELLNQDVALKLLLPQVAKDRDAVARFIHEGRATARLRSPHVVRVMDVGMVDGVPFLAMELLAGRDLGALLETRGRFMIQETVDHLLEAMEGLSHAHAVGIVHRDLKPSNLFLAQDEHDVRTIKVVDFGISKSMNADGANITSTAAVLGSPAYMAPEQLRSSKYVDARVDVWSLGVIAFELLTMSVPFQGDSIGEIFANVIEKPPIRPTTLRVEIPGKLEEAILRCLQKSPDARFANLGALASAIARFGTGRCDPLVASIEKRLAAPGAVPVISSPSIPDLEPPSAPRSRPSAPKASAPPMAISSSLPGFDFDDDAARGPRLETMDEARPRVSRAAAATVVTRHATAGASVLPGEFFRETFVPVALHSLVIAATFFALHHFVSLANVDVFALLPGTTTGSPSKTTAIVGGVFAALAVGCSIAALAIRPARWGFAIATLGLVAIALGMFLIMGASSGGVVGAPAGEKMFVVIGSPMIAVGLAVACLGKARDAWRDYARAVPLVLAALAGALLFVAVHLAARF
jgi:serine/threonine-protein kinase